VLLPLSATETSGWFQSHCSAQSAGVLLLWPVSDRATAAGSVRDRPELRGGAGGARAFAIASLFAALWLAGAVAELLAADVSAAIMWLKFEVVFQLPVATATTCFVLEYAYPGRWLTRRTLILLSVPPLLVLLLVLTDDLHHWFWRGFSFYGSLQPLRGMANWIAMGYDMALVLVNITVFVWLFIRSPRHRWPLALMMVGQIASRALYVLNLPAERIPSSGGIPSSWGS
jgi:hypothetical protein